MKYISLDNGATYSDAYSAAPTIIARDLWPAIVDLMDDATREYVHATYTTTTIADFLARYLEHAPHDLVLG